MTGARQLPESNVIVIFTYMLSYKENLENISYSSLSEQKEIKLKHYLPNLSYLPSIVLNTWAVFIPSRFGTTVIDYNRCDSFLSVKTL